VFLENLRQGGRIIKPAGSGLIVHSLHVADGWVSRQPAIGFSYVYRLRPFRAQELELLALRPENGGHPLAVDALAITSTVPPRSTKLEISASTAQVPEPVIRIASWSRSTSL
jgi:hypothetical protein